MPRARGSGCVVWFWVQLPPLVVVPLVATYGRVIGIWPLLRAQDLLVLTLLSVGAVGAAAYLQLRYVRGRLALSVALTVLLYMLQFCLLIWCTSAHEEAELRHSGVLSLGHTENRRDGDREHHVRQEPAKGISAAGAADDVVGVGASSVARSSSERIHLPPFAAQLRSTSAAKTISVILPCADERETSVRTVERFCERTPAENLAEIIVVDDGSRPPLKSLFAKDTRRLDLNPRCKLKFIRHEITTGLMAAKLTGGKAAIGDIFAFIDCHCAPQWHWERPIIKLISENPRRMVVPEITDLDYDTFDEKVPTAIYAKCYLTFDGDFKWFDDRSDFIPTISGGLVAMGAEWFNLTGGFDEAMHGWGGENLDQSLRAWLCGGDIVRGRGSKIAHMWRSGDPRTAAHYHVKAKSTNNRGRVAAAWYDAFLPVFRGRAVDAAEVKAYDDVKKRLACRPFSYFVYRFRRIYIEGGVIPKQVFHVREKQSQLCLSRHSGSVGAEDCADGRRGQQFQLGNVDPLTNKCCAGLRLYGTNDCIDFMDAKGPHFYPCDVSGLNTNQAYRMLETGHIRKDLPTQEGHECLFIGTKGAVEKKACGRLEAGQGVFERIFQFKPREWQIYEAELQKYGYEEDFPDLPDN